MQTAYEEFTDKEITILRWIANGWSNREIADELIISMNTVRWYNKQIYSKLGVHSRTKAAALAQDMGLLQDEATEADEPEIEVHTHTTNLPSQLTPFIGRQDSVAAIDKMLSNPDIRLVTIMGPGGMGKTRLAIEAATGFQEEFGDGVYLIALGDLDTSKFIFDTADEFIVAAIASTLHLTFYANAAPRKQLLDFLADQQTLLVLDNFEHLLDGADLVNDMLEAAPDIKVLVTSRETLGLYGESVFYVDSMTSRNADSEAVQLFLQSARRAGATIQSDAATLNQILEICKLIDGLPLAIELAASWVRALPLTTIIEELKQGLDILETRTGSVRHAFDKSWHLLTDEEKQAFASLGVFQGGFTHEAAEAVTGASWRMLSSLVDKSLMWRTDENRYAMHELLRQYALEKIPEVADLTTLQSQHSDYFAGLADHWGAELRGGDQINGLKVIETEFENIRRSWHTAIQHQNADALYRLLNIWFYFEIRSRWHEAHEIFETALKLWPPDDSPALAKLLAVQATFTWRLGLWDESEALANRSIEIAMRLGDEAATVHPRLTLGNIASMRGDYAEGRRIYMENIAVARKYNDQFNQTLMLMNLGIVARMMGEFEEARDILQQLLTITIETNDPMGQVFTLSNLSKALQQLDQHDLAEEYLKQSIPLAREIEQQYILASATSELGQIAITRGNYRTAEKLTRESISLNRRHGHREQLGQNLLRLGQLFNSQGNITGAAQCLYEGLEILAAHNTVGYVLIGLTYSAELLMKQGDVVTAVQVLALVRDHEAAEQAIRDETQALLDELQEELPPEFLAEAIAQSQQLDWQAAHTLILDRLRPILPQI